MDKTAYCPTQGEGITRRSFLKGTAGIGLVILVAEAAGGALVGLSGCAKPTADIPVTSSTDFNHAHGVTIPGADIDSAPDSKTYTSDGPTHQHDITLVKADFQAIKQGQAVTKTSTAVGTTPHTHTFTIMKA
ncbi:MAG: hypothetical protein Q8Q07_00290 [Dehalococcoidales bacterium]|nr:hypothetical protein [Dehalococcoidales bacterium]